MTRNLTLTCVLLGTLSDGLTMILDRRQGVSSATKHTRHVNAYMYPISSMSCCAATSSQPYRHHGLKSVVLLCECTSIVTCRIQRQPSSLTERPRSVKGRSVGIPRVCLPSDCVYQRAHFRQFVLGYGNSRFEETHGYFSFRSP
ncbi:hypothetical protein BR93DRAFT_142250 [Coniochaeta sp. PMI_546]|nr:hypothetical protein BR93DRAFT_142250 [Coniochaeta sp. PMI_546]